jgi:hypothetical protein
MMMEAIGVDCTWCSMMIVDLDGSLSVCNVVVDGDGDCIW